MNKVVKKTQCPECMDTGRDNLAVYSDGSTYCFGCGYFENDKTEQKETIPVSDLVTNGSCEAYNPRKISKKTNEFCNYQVAKFSGYIGNDQVKNEPVHVYNYTDEYGKTIWQKIRASGKRMTIRGDTSNMRLGGISQYNPNPNVFIVITEGEIDRASIIEAQGTRFPVVTLPNGVNSAKQIIAKDLELLSKFKFVVLAFDSDEAGKKASEECIELFEPGKVRVAKWPLKDANDLLVADRKEDIKESIFNAKEVRPDKLCTPEDLLDRILERPDEGIAWPWADMTKCTLGCRENQLIVIGAAPGIGKTEMVKDIVLHMASGDEMKTGMFSFEQDAADTVRRLVGGMLNKPLHIPGAWWDEDLIKDKIKELENKVYVYDNWGGAKVEDIVPKMRYLTKAYDVKLFVIDHLTALAAKMDGDERRGIEKAMELLASLTRELRCSILLVSHLARDKISGTKEDTWGAGRKPVMENFKGSGAIEAWADAVFGLSRNADSDDVIEKQLLGVECLKARLDGSKRGYSFMLKYNENTGKLEDIHV